MADNAPDAARTRLRLVSRYTAVLVAYAGIVASAVAGRPWLFVGLVIVAHGMDVLAERTSEIAPIMLRSQLALSHRTIARDLAVALLALQVSWDGRSTPYIVAVLALLMPPLRTLFLTAQVPLRRRLTVPVEVRNVDLSGVPLARRPPEFLLARSTPRLHHLDLAPTVAAGLAAAIGVPALDYVVAGLVLGVLLATVGTLAGSLLQFRTALHGDALLAAVMGRVNARRPEVVLHHSGSADTTYQVDMWLSTMDRLSRSAVVVLRERRLFELVGATETPVVCIPDSLDLMNVPLPDVRAVLYTANVGKNIHLLRVPGIRHVFIGHGDSDKTASFNPFSKVYSEIWVAGPAGRDRYLRADVGVRDEDIAEVGRPQLAGIRSAAESRTGPLLTLLYAPTWEGWTNDPYATSLLLAGPAMVARLVEFRPRVRVIYKPHPLTGKVSRAAIGAHQRIVDLLTQDNAVRALDRELAALPGGTVGRLDRAALDQQPLPPDASPAAHEANNRRWAAAWWPAEPSWAHRVVTGAMPQLYDCFNAANLLVADISSVVSDFLASGKPYVVTNVAGLPDDEFRDTYPTAAAAYLLDPHADQMPIILELVRGDDPMVGARRQQKTYLLGPDEPDALTRFNEAVNRAVLTAQRSWPQRPVSAAAVD